MLQMDRNNEPCEDNFILGAFYFILFLCTYK